MIVGTKITSSMNTPRTRQRPGALHPCGAFRSPKNARKRQRAGALQNAAAAICMRLTCAIVASLLLASCLDFGEELEYFAPDVTAAHLEVIEKRTGIDLPVGSVGIALFSNATGIDPWMLTKIKIPSDKVGALLDSKPFKSPPPKTPSSMPGVARPWWKPHELSNVSSGEFNIKSTLVTWSLGQEGSAHILYIGWFTF